MTIQLDFSGSLDQVVGPMYVIGAFFLLIGLIVSSMRAMAAVVGGTDTASRAFSAVALRICCLAFVIAAWHTILPFTVKLANGLSGYVLDDQAVQTALQKSFFVTEAFGGAAGAACAGTGVGCVVTPIILLVLLLLVAVTIVTVLILKYILAFGFAVAYVGGPVALGVAGIPGVGESALNMLVRSVCVFMMIPLVWCICFAAWVGVVASTIDTPSGAQDAVLQVVNGPGMFAAAMLVLLGVTRKLLQMAMPLGAPLGLPGPLRFLLATAAVKFGGPMAQAAVSKMSGDQGPSLTEQQMVSEHNANHHSLPYPQMPLPYGERSSDRTGETLAAIGEKTPATPEAGSTPALTAASPSEPPEEALQLARERVAGFKQTVTESDVHDAWAGMTTKERGVAVAAADHAIEQPSGDQQASYVERMVDATARDEFANPQAAGVLATAHPDKIKTLAAAEPGATPSVRTRPTDAEERVRSGDFLQDELIGGALRDFVRPVPPPLPPSSSPSSDGSE